MATIKRIVCLANSRKLSGRCVAGVEIATGRRAGWVRPVSARENEEVSEYERQYENGADPRLLDIIDVPLLEARPKHYQSENWLLDPYSYWVKQGQFARAKLGDLLDPVAPLWTDGQCSYNGRNDRILFAQATTLPNSLRFIAVTDLLLRVFKPGEAFGNPKRRVQAQFTHNGANYWLWVTDPDFERNYLAKPDGDYKIGEAFLTVSLGEKHTDGYCYKLVAAIIPKA